MLEVWDSDAESGEQDQLIGRLSIPFQSIQSPKKKQKNPDADLLVTGDLQNEGKAAGTITYKAGYKNFETNL